MCGIVAVFGDITIKTEQVFKQMLILDSLRGLDSTGVASVDKNGDIEVVKEVGNPFYLLDSPRFEKMMRGGHSFLLGHNRAATIGKVSRANAHPFEIDGTVVGAHNGSLTNKFDLPNHAKYDTDSEAIFANIENQGAEKTIPMLSGAWSLVWYDNQEETLNLIRNEERPMCCAFSEDLKTLFMASEAWMISVACSRNGVKISKIFETEPDNLYTFNKPINFQPLKEPKILKLEGKKKAVTTTQTSSVTGKVVTATVGTNQSPIKAREGELFIPHAGMIEVVGKQVFHNPPKTPNVKGIWYVLLEPNDSAVKTAPMYIYFTSMEEAHKIMTGVWIVSVHRTVSNNGVVTRYIMDSSQDSYCLVEKDGQTAQSIYQVKCCNCNSKIELEEDWMKTSQGILCQSCAEDPDVLALITQVTNYGH